MHGLVILDEHDQVIRPAILWNDGRTAEEVNYLPENDTSTIIKYSGNKYNYTADGGIEWVTTSNGEYRYDANSVSLGYIRLEPGKWYYIGNNVPWKGTLCVPQTH